MIKKCLNCGKDFETLYNRAKFCSTHCSDVYRRKSGEKGNTVCKHCGKNFFSKSKFGYCSIECALPHINEYKKEIGFDPNKTKGKGGRKKVCEVCGDEYYTRNYNAKTCCDLCASLNRMAATQKRTSLAKEVGPNGEPYKNICNNCKKEFWTFRKTNKTCSEECLHALSHGAEKVKKTKESLIKKYGEDYGKKLSDMSKKGTFEKYGVDHWNQLPENREKQRQIMSDKVYQEKLKQGMRDKYGVDNAMEIEEFREKISENHKKLAEQGFLKNLKHITNFDKWNDIDFIKKTFINKEDKFLMKEFCEFFNITFTGATQRKNHFLGLKQYENANSRTKTQHSIYEFITSFYKGEVKYNERKVLSNKELDIYIPEKKFAIEYDGFMFHSFGKSKISMFNNAEEEIDARYHLLEKTEMCEEQGIKLFHIWENEWVDPIKQEIWKSMIKVALNCAEVKLNARDCEIREVSSNESTLFLDKNHLQGSINSSIRYGLFYNNELVQILAFGKSRYNNDYDFELYRQCTKLDTIVRGGFSKLLNYFKEHHKGSIISYGNRRWTSTINNIYGNHFKKTLPNYFYFLDEHNPIMLSRLQFQKYMLKDKLKNFSEDLTETENMYNNGYRKIYDCGNLVSEL